MTTLLHAQKWIEDAWSKEGRKFRTTSVPVARYEQLDVDDLSFAFKNTAITTWFLNEGKLESNAPAQIIRVPYIAFSIDDEMNSMRIQVFWDGRCGYGFEIAFDDTGEVGHQRMRWVS